MDFVKELTWRGMIHDMTPGTDEIVRNGGKAGYAGFDPTGSSLHIGHMIPIMLLMHLQRCGNKPIALVGGATGMIGDPSGKSEERKLLSMDVIAHNQECIKRQLSKFIDFSGKSGAEIVNNHDWFKDIRFLDFLRDVGKHLTVNYMVAKDSVKGRWESGISFTEFSYQLLQAYDFCWLYENKGCILQIGGSDQWGNITSGTELIRRKIGGDAYALTCPLLTRSDGKKFGKSEGGESVWLDPTLTSPYKFYQYWLNCTDEDAPKLLRIFTLMGEEQIRSLEQEHASAPHLRTMQKALAKDITVRIHSEVDYQAAVAASEILFGQGTSEALRQLSERDFATIFEGVPQSVVAKSDIDAGVKAIDLLTEKAQVFPSKGELRRTVQNGGLSINKEKISDSERMVGLQDVLSGRFILVQKGKKSYHLIVVG